MSVPLQRAVGLSSSQIINAVERALQYTEAMMEVRQDFWASVIEEGVQCHRGAYNQTLGTVFHEGLMLAMISWREPIKATKGNQRHHYKAAAGVLNICRTGSEKGINRALQVSMLDTPLGASFRLVTELQIPRDPTVGHPAVKGRPLYESWVRAVVIYDELYDGEGWIVWQRATSSKRVATSAPGSSRKSRKSGYKRGQGKDSTKKSSGDAPGPASGPEAG